MSDSVVFEIIYIEYYNVVIFLSIFTLFAQ